MAVEINDLFQQFLVQNLPEFSGEKTENPIEWIESFEKKTRSLTPEKQLEQIKYCFVRTAKYWYQEEVKNKIKDLKYEDFRKIFLKKFLSLSDRDHAVKKLKELTYNPSDMTVSSFVTNFRHWYCRIHPTSTSQELISDIFERYSAEFREKFLLAADLESVSGIEEFVTISERIERSLDIRREDNFSSME